MSSPSQEPISQLSNFPKTYSAKILDIFTGTNTHSLNLSSLDESTHLHSGSVPALDAISLRFLPPLTAGARSEPGVNTTYVEAVAVPRQYANQLVIFRESGRTHGALRPTTLLRVEKDRDGVEDGRLEDAGSGGSHETVHGLDQGLAAEAAAAEQISFHDFDKYPENDANYKRKESKCIRINPTWIHYAQREEEEDENLNPNERNLIDAAEGVLNDEKGHDEFVKRFSLFFLVYFFRELLLFYGVNLKAQSITMILYFGISRILSPCHANMN